MPRTERFSERIGAVFIPQADQARVVDARSTDAAGAPPGGEPCSTVLKDGCYTPALVPDGVPPAGTRYGGTLRVETLPTGLRFSGDLYRHHLLDRLITDPLGERAPPSDQAADTGGVIPIYPRRDYHAYLRGTEAVLTSVAPRGAGCPFTLEFEEFTYSHSDVGFDGRFQPPPARTIRFALAPTASPKAQNFWMTEEHRTKGAIRSPLGVLTGRCP